MISPLRTSRFFRFAFSFLQKQGTAYAFEMLDFFVYLRFLDLELARKATLAKIFLGIAVYKPAVDGNFVAQKRLFAFFTARHIRASLF